MGLSWVHRFIGFIIPVSLNCFVISCTEQHRPEAHHKAIKIERVAANKPIARLTSEGKIPVATDAPKGSGNPKYDTLCAACHGLDGRAATPTAKALNPKPRDFTDAAWQASTDDARINKVIVEGGAAVGLSPTMAPWGAMVSGSELTKMLKTIRDFKK